MFLLMLYFLHKWGVVRKLVLKRGTNIADGALAPKPIGKSLCICGKNLNSRGPKAC